MTKIFSSKLRIVILSTTLLLSTKAVAFKGCLELPVLNTGLIAVIAPKIKDCCVKYEYGFLKNTTGAGSCKIKTELSVGDAAAVGTKINKSLLPFLLKECVYTDCTGYTFGDVLGSRVAYSITHILKHAQLKELVKKLYQEKIAATNIKAADLRRYHIINIIKLRTEIRRILEEELGK